jgi:hypothetical protein
MDLTPKSYTNSSSPRFPPAYRHHSTLTPPTYPTPPQSRANTEALPSHTPAMSGLGILNYGPLLPVTQVSICSSSQSLLQPTLSWPHESPVTTGYSHPSPEVGVYAGHGMYDNYDTLPADMHSPFVMPNTQAEAANMLAFLSPQLQHRAGNPSVECTPILNNYVSNPQTPSVPRTRVTGRNRYGVFEDTAGSPMPRNNVKRSFSHIDGFSYESPPSSLPPTSGATGTTISLAGSVESSATQPQAQRSPLQSSHANAPLRANDTRSSSENPPKAKREKKGPPKFYCEVCNKRFTRNSNRSAHMKTHDPQRQRPNECTRLDCQMKFSRPTDLNRHIKSVSLLALRFPVRVTETVYRSTTTSKTTTARSVERPFPAGTP